MKLSKNWNIKVFLIVGMDFKYEKQIENKTKTELANSQ